MKVTGRRLRRNLPYNPIGEVVARGQWSLFSFNHYVPDMAHGNCLAAGGCPCGLIRSVSPLSSHASLHVTGALMAFKCLTHAHNIRWPSPQLERRQRRDPHPFGQQLLGCSEQGGLCNTPEGNPGQSSSVASTALTCLQRVPMRKKRGGGGRGPKVHIQATKNVMVRTWVRKEFPYMRQNEKEIKFIRVGNAVRTVGQLKGEPTLNRGP